jgi:transcriptional regulator with XRE-family HTH domain
MKTLAERLTWARTKKDMSQQQLADKAGVAQSTIGSLEAGTRLSARKITSIANALDVNGRWLAEGMGAHDLKAPQPAEPTPKIRRNLQWVDDDEAELLSEYRRLELGAKKTSLVVLRSLPKVIPDDRADDRND